MMLPIAVLTVNAIALVSAWGIPSDSAQEAGVVQEIIVAQDGSGDFRSVQKAFDAVPDYSDKRTVILIKAGIYKEKLVLRKAKRHVTLMGEALDKVILTYDDFAGRIVGSDTITTYTSYSTCIEADDILAMNLTFQNSAGPVGQAVAVEVRGDRIEFVGCRIIGNQDTFFTNSEGRCYLKQCYIEGTTDFIFGKAVAVFDSCMIFSKKNSFVTAASTPQGREFGYVFRHCQLTAADSVTKVYLGRPWRPYAKTVFLRCAMGSHIHPSGWHNWSKPEREKSTFYAEYRNTGPGADTTGRVGWSRQLTYREATEYTLTRIFSPRASDTTWIGSWIPRR